MHVYMPNPVCPSVRSVWTNQSPEHTSDLQSCLQSHRWLFREPTNTSICAPQTFLRMFLAALYISHLFLSSVRDDQRGFVDKVTCHVCASCHHLSPEVGGEHGLVFKLNSQALRSSLGDLRFCMLTMSPCPLSLCVIIPSCFSARFQPPLPRFFVLFSKHLVPIKYKIAQSA